MQRETYPQPNIIIASPSPLDVEPKAMPDIDTTSYSGVFNAWSGNAIADDADRQEAIAILTRPTGFGLSYPYPQENQHDLLEAPAEITGENEATLRGFLRDRPELSLELAAGIKSWYAECENTDKSPDCRSRLQLEYQDLILELIAAVPPEEIKPLLALYPSIGSQAVREGLADYSASTLLLNDPEIPKAIKLDEARKWTELAKDSRLPSDENGPMPPYHDWLLEAFGPWAASPNVSLDAVEDIAAYFEFRAGLKDTDIYIEPRLAGQIGKHIDIPDIFFGFATRHVMYQKTRKNDPEEFSIATDEDKEFLSRLDRAHKPGIIIRRIGSLISGRKSKPSAYEIRSKELWSKYSPDH